MNKSNTPAFLLVAIVGLMMGFCHFAHSAETAIKNLKLSGTLDATGVTSSTGISALGAQPLDADLTAIAALTTTSYGRSVLAVADAAALRTYAGLVIGTNVLAPSGDGSALTSLNGSNIASGTVPSARLGTNLAAMKDNTSTSLTMGNVTPTFASVIAATATHSGAVTAGTLAVGSGTVITKIMTGVQTMDFPSTATLSSSTLTMTVTGAAPGDCVFIATPTAAVLTNSCFTGWVSASNTVTIQFNNYSIASQDPASGVFSAIVFHF